LPPLLSPIQFSRINKRREAIIIRKKGGEANKPRRPILPEPGENDLGSTSLCGLLPHTALIPMLHIAMQPDGMAEEGCLPSLKLHSEPAKLTLVP
jgi:hypothetical protein